MATVKMHRDPVQYPAPHSVDVHPSMVDEYRAGGFVPDDSVTLPVVDKVTPEQPKRGRPRKD